MSRPPRVAGTTTTWWATVLTVAVLASMLSTLLFAFPYLSAGQPWGPSDAPPLGFAAAAAGFVLASMVPTVLLHRAVGRGSARAVAAGAVASLALGAAFVASAVADLIVADPQATVDAWSSTRVVVVVFHLVVAAAGLLLLAALPLRLWGAELDRRQQAMSVSAAILWYYVVGGWLAVTGMVHVVPALR